MAVNEVVLLYQVLVAKRKSKDSWELSSWRGTSIQECPAAKYSPGLLLFCFPFHACIGWELHKLKLRDYLCSCRCH